jgi:hypothetical protein
MMEPGVEDMRRLLTGLVLMAAMGATAAVRAVEVPRLYEAEVPVSGQGAVERVAASHAGLEEVLVKVTGGREVLQRPEIQALLDQAEQWVQRYQYRAAPPVSAPPAEGTAAPLPMQMLWLAYDRQFINQRLAEAGVPVWGLNRPRTVVWLAEEKAGGRFLVGGDNRPDLQQALIDQAERRGLPLTLPLLDLQDQRALNAADVWGDFADVITRASERYQPEALLVGRVYQVASDQWQGQWTLYHRGAATTWESAPGQESDAVAAGIAGTADQFAKRYALSLTAEAANSMTLTVENVASLTDYARALAYLKSLDPVAGVQVAEVQGDAVNFRLKLRSDPQAVVRSIGWGSTLVTAAGPETPLVEDRGDGTAAAAGEYRYRMAP